MSDILKRSTEEEFHVHQLPNVDKYGKGSCVRCDLCGKTFVAKYRDFGMGCYGKTWVREWPLGFLWRRIANPSDARGLD